MTWLQAWPKLSATLVMSETPFSRFMRSSHIQQCTHAVAHNIMWVSSVILLNEFQYQYQSLQQVRRCLIELTKSTITKLVCCIAHDTVCYIGQRADQQRTGSDAAQRWLLCLCHSCRITVSCSSWSAGPKQLTVPSRYHVELGIGQGTMLGSMLCPSVMVQECMHIHIIPADAVFEATSCNPLMTRTPHIYSTFKSKLFVFHLCANQ